MAKQSNKIKESLREFNRRRKIRVREMLDDWTGKDIAKSILFFLLHTFVLVLIMAAVLLGRHVKELRAYLTENGAEYLYALFCVMLLMMIMYFYFLFEDRQILRNGNTICLIFVVVDLHFLISWVIGEYIHVYARPVAFAGLLIYALLRRKDAIFINVICSLLIFVTDTFTGMGGASAGIAARENYSSLIMSFSAGMIAIYLCNSIKSRFAVVLVGIAIVVPIEFIIFILELSTFLEDGGVRGLSDMQNILLLMGYGLAGGVLSAMLFLPVLPILEVAFKRLTVFRLHELTSTDAKLLKMLQEEAPGTADHVKDVAKIAEECAVAIGEDAELARAAALYHDVGKMVDPEYFTENQSGYNPHSELPPEVSAEIIRSHVTKGAELIRRNHLPEILADVALQHHGTLRIRYFHEKAKRLTDGKVNKEDYCYCGPKPQTKIAAIIMIADGAEAAVRAAKTKDPLTVSNITLSIINERMQEEQFTECDITMAELTKIHHALIHALTGQYHHRIEYPDVTDDD